MPSTVREVFADAALEAAGCVRWCERIPRPRPGEPKTGVYVVALTDDVDALDAAMPECPLRLEALNELLAVRPELRLDGENASAAALAERLAEFWLRDEVVLYIGCAGQPLGTRVRSYYRTTLGAKRPHAGGWWVKTLSVLPELWVHYARTAHFANAEVDMLHGFGERVSASSRRAFASGSVLLPFANLEIRRRKPHGIEHATGPLGGSQRAWPC